MPTWLPSVIIGILSATAGIIGTLGGVILSHRLQRRRDRAQESRAAHFARVAHQRELCTSLLDAVIQQKSFLFTLRSLHDNRAARLTAQKTIELESKKLLSADENVRRVRRELDLEPNAQLQAAIEQHGDAAIAYQQALIRPFLSIWNPVQSYLGKIPQEEVDRLAGEVDARTQELQATVRG